MPLEERKLIAQLQAGDPGAYETLVRTYGGRMLAVARRFVRDDDEARDCVQEAFLRVFRSIERFESRSALGTWLHRIVVNTALSRLRSRERTPEESLSHLLPRFDADGMRLEPEPEPAEHTPEALLESAEAVSLVHRCIDELPAAYRQVILLRDVEGYDTEETATLLGLTPGAVKVRLHRARAALKTLLAPLVQRP